jgi:hypothetical protein
MTTYAALVSLEDANQIPEDVITNTLHFEHAQEGPPDFANLDDILFDFYNAVPVDAGSLTDFFTTKRISKKITFQYYDLSTPKPRVPAHIEVRELDGVGSGNQLPGEVALCLSWQAAKEAGVSQARRRNRIYIGGLSTTAAEDDGRPRALMLASMASNARDMLAAADSSLSWEWVVYSPTNQEQYPIDNGWVDDSFDTQRRRGRAPTSRVIWDNNTP